MKALITGYTGQDGTFLTKLLLEKGYTVIGMVRRVSTEPPVRGRNGFDFSQSIDNGQLILEPGDLTDAHSLRSIVGKHKPDEVYNLAAQSDVGLSFKQPFTTIQQNFIGVYNLLNAVRDLAPNARFYQASTSELFGRQQTDTILHERTPFKPASPYAEAKLAAYWAVVNDRNRGNFSANGILFNHESELRGGNFVTQKIVRGLVGMRKTGRILSLGNLDAVRDWGYAGDYVDAMWRILHYDTAEDFVVCTGIAHTIRQFVEKTVAHTFNKTVEWVGSGADEVGKVEGLTVVKVDKQFYRPNEVPFLRGSSAKAKTVLGWKPTTNLDQIIAKMVNYEESRLGL